MLKIKRKKEILNEIIEPIMGKLEFQSRFLEVDGFQEWNYMRERQGRYQNISITDGGIARGLRLSFSVSGLNRTQIQNYLIEELKEYQSIIDFYTYRNEEEFVKIITAFKEAIIHRGLNILANFIQEVNQSYPQLEHYQYLCDKKDELVGNFFEENSTKNMEEQFFIINRMVIALMDKSLDYASLELIKIAAIYGTYLIRNFGGMWVWEPTKFYWLEKVGENCLIENPLLYIYTQWDKKYILSKREYDQVINNYAQKWGH